MSALLNAIGSNVQSLANGALSSLIGGNISSGISKDMMRYQDKLNDQNALDAYNRQRALMGDAALLQKQGMLKAGYNIAFGSNGSVMNAGTPSSSNVGLGSSDSKMPNSFQSLLDAKNVESNAKVADSNSKLLDSKKVGQDIDNDYKVANAVADLSNKAADTRDKNAKARSNELANVLLSKYGDRLKAAETGKAESDEAAAADNAALASINRQIAQSTRPDKEALAHELVENERKRGRLLNAQVVTENGKVLVQRSEIAKNYADAENKREETAGFKLNNEYLSKTLVDRVNQQGYDAVLKKIATLPHSYRDVVMRSHQWQVMVYKLEHNQQLSEQELKNLDELLRLDTYDPNKNAANWINFVTHMK
jgi:F0F1-type ATP synthase assembly protein I